MPVSKSNWVPEILYEEAEDGLTSKIPFIQVPDDEEMPSILFMFESRDTGDFEPGLDGEEVPVTELDLYQYANMSILKSKLSWAEYDNVRFALGLEPLKTAAIKGQKITSNIRVAVSDTDTIDDLDKTDKAKL
jgi:hypothetical protein